LARSALLLLGVGLAALGAIGAWPSLLKGSAYAASAVGGAVGVSGFEFWQTWMLGVVVFAWSAMLLALRIPGLASLPPIIGLDGARRGKSSFTCHNSLID
jgi:hypothetical protein